MEKQSVQDLVRQGLSAMKAGSNVGEKATAEIQNDARNESLKELLNQGNEHTKIWARRLDQALAEAGGEADKENRILQAHYEVSKEIRRNAQSDEARDLGIIAAGQMALHYWIAAFGTMKTYAEFLGLDQTADDMKDCVEEAKEADEAHTQVALGIMGQQMPNQKSNSKNQFQHA